MREQLTSEIPYRNFKVLAPDPDHFDSDGDGIGCES
jgi:micrococcal nuclease